MCLPPFNQGSKGSFDLSFPVLLFIALFSFNLFQYCLCLFCLNTFILLFKSIFFNYCCSFVILYASCITCCPIALVVNAPHSHLIQYINICPFVNYFFFPSILSLQHIKQHNIYFLIFCGHCFFAAQYLISQSTSIPLYLCGYLLFFLMHLVPV